MSRDLCHVFTSLPPTPLRQGNNSFATFLVFGSFPHPNIVYSCLPYLLWLFFFFFLKVMNTFLMGIHAGPKWEDQFWSLGQLVSSTVHKPQSLALFSPQERMHHRLSLQRPDCPGCFGRVIQYHIRHGGNI